jgi:hypothetical protein
MVCAIAIAKRMVIVIFHHDPVVWHGADLHNFRSDKSIAQFVEKLTN